MDFAYPPAEDAFRQELRAWLEPNIRDHRAQWGTDEVQKNIIAERQLGLPKS